MVSGSALVSALISVIVVGLICSLLWWLVGKLKLREPFNQAAYVIIAVIAVVFLINILLSLTGHSFIRW